jgi:hypothetical protein
MLLLPFRFVHLKNPQDGRQALTAISRADNPVGAGYEAQGT